MSVPGEFTAGDVLAASEINALPGGVLGRAEITTGQAGISALTDVTGLSATVTVAAARLIRVTAYCWSTTATNATDRSVAHIREGSTSLQKRIHQYSQTTASNGMHLVWEGTPSSGAHTYKVSFERLAGSGTLTWSAATDSPSFISVEDLGPA